MPSTHAPPQDLINCELDLITCVPYLDFRVGGGSSIVTVTVYKQPGSCHTSRVRCLVRCAESPIPKTVLYRYNRPWVLAWV